MITQAMCVYAIFGKDWQGLHNNNNLISPDNAKEIKTVFVYPVGNSIRDRFLNLCRAI